MIKCSIFRAIPLAILGIATISSASLAQDADPYPATIIFQSGYSHNWLEEQSKSNHFADFSAEGFYGAFVANDDGDSYWYSGFHDLEAARIGALAWCELDKPPAADPCELVAYLVPQHVPDDFISGLSHSAIDEYIEYLTYGGFRAFAVSPSGAYAYAWDHLTQTNANGAALETCNDSARDKNDWEIGQSNACVLLQQEPDMAADIVADPFIKPKPEPKIKK